MSRKYWMIAAIFTLATNGMAQGTMKHDMTQGAMKHDMAAMPSLESMIQRADSLVGRTEKMMRMAGDTTAHAMMMDHSAGSTPKAMASGLHEMAAGLREVLQHMDAMHRKGMKMEGDAGAAMMEVHRRMSTMLVELEKTLMVTDRMHADRAMGSP